MTNPLCHYQHPTWASGYAACGCGPTSVTETRDKVTCKGCTATRAFRGVSSGRPAVHLVRSHHHMACGCPWWRCKGGAATRNPAEVTCGSCKRTREYRRRAEGFLAAWRVHHDEERDGLPGRWMDWRWWARRIEQDHPGLLHRFPEAL